MTYKIIITPEADDHLRSLTAREQRIVETEIMIHLQHQPTVLCKAVTRLQPNPLAEYELRIRTFRVLYNVEEDVNEVVIVAVGRKVGNKLRVKGAEFHEHEDNPSA